LAFFICHWGRHFLFIDFIVTVANTAMTNER
jgi:hypothetical protein